MTLEQFGWFVTTTIAVIGLVLAIRKSKPDISNMNAKTTKLFQEMLKEEVEKGIAKDKTILGMGVRIKSLEDEYEKLCIENANLTDWCKRLVRQVVEIGHTPVNMHSSNRGKPE